MAAPLQQKLIAAAQLSGAVQLKVVCLAVVSKDVPQDCTPPHATAQVLGVPKHLISLHVCRPGQLMSQALARQMIGMLEQDLSPLQPMSHWLPAQSTPWRQLEAPQVMSQDEALVQSTKPPLQLLSAHSTRHGMPAAQCGAQSGVLH